MNDRIQAIEEFLKSDSGAGQRAQRYYSDVTVLLERIHELEKITVSTFTVSQLRQIDLATDVMHLVDTYRGEPAACAIGLIGE